MSAGSLHHPDSRTAGDQGACLVCGHPTKLLHADVFDDRHGYPRLFSISECGSCGFCRTEPSLDREELGAVYRDFYPRSRESAQGVLAAFAALKNRTPFTIWLEGGGTACYLSVPPGKKVLDLGCGNCLSLLMAKHYGARQVLGVDVDPNILPIARELGVEVHVGQLSDLPGEKGLFDYILAQQVLEHEPDPARLLLEMTARLADGGRIVMSFPNAGALYRHVFGKRWLHWHPPYHINHFSKQSVLMLAERCGLRALSMKTVTPNAWMTYQLRTLRMPYVPGQRDHFWDPGAAAGDPPVKGTARMIPEKVRHALFSHGFLPAVCLTNRLLDAAGLGESFVVELAR